MLLLGLSVGAKVLRVTHPICKASSGNIELPLTYMARHWLKFQA